MGTTSPDALGYPDIGYTSGIRLAVKALADTTQTALNSREIHTYQWADSTARAAETGMAEGDIGYQADTNFYYKYSGSAWGLLSDALAALTPAIPVTTFSAVTSVTVVPFSAAWDNYTCILELTATSGAAGQVYAQLKAGAGATVTTNYSGGAYEVSTGGVGAATAGPTSAFIVGRVGAATSSGRNRFEIYSPFLTVPTYVEGAGVAGDGVVRVGQGGLNTNATSYDSLVFTLSTGGTMTGRTWFEGWSKA